MVPNLFGTRNQFHGRQFFHRPQLGGGFGFRMIQVRYTHCALFFFSLFSIITSAPLQIIRHYQILEVGDLCLTPYLSSPYLEESDPQHTTVLSETRGDQNWYGPVAYITQVPRATEVSFLHCYSHAALTPISKVLSSAVCFQQAIPTSPKCSNSLFLRWLAVTIYEALYLIHAICSFQQQYYKQNPGWLKMADSIP